MKALKKSIHGRSLQITRRDADWLFDFAGGPGLCVQSFWRLRSTREILLTDADDHQRFGLPEPVDAEKRANEIVAGGVAKSLNFDSATGDLDIGLSNGVVIQIISNSLGYESWQAYSDENELLAVAGNGGLR